MGRHRGDIGVSGPARMRVPRFCSRGLDPAKTVVVDQPGLRRRVAAYGAGGVPAEIHFAPARLERVENQETSGERRPAAEQKLDRLHRLHRTDHARKHAQHASLGTVGHESGRWRLPEEAPVAGCSLDRENRHLSLPAEDGAVHVRFAEEHARIVDEIARRKVVGAVHDHVVTV